MRSNLSGLTCAPARSAALDLTSGVLVGLALALSLPLAAEQPAGLRAVHDAGQTRLMWREVDPPLAKDAATMGELKRAKAAVGKPGGIRYRVYRSATPIASLDGLVPLAELPPLTGWNADHYGEDDKPDRPAFRYVVEDGKGPVPPGTGVFAHNPAGAGDAWYAVTAVAGGTEDRTLGANVLREPVRETVGPGAPVLQRVERPEEFTYVKGPTLHFYVRWESPPTCNVPGRPYDYLVAVPPDPARPAPVGLHLHCWGGSLHGGYGWWYNAEKGAMLIASNQVPYDWWTGYHEHYGLGPRERDTWAKGVVRPYTQRRLLAFLDWAATQWEIDRSRVFAAGNSMGGSGSPMLAIRHPDRVAWAVSWVGVHVPAMSPQFAGSYAQVYGEPDWGVRFEDGTPVWDHFSDAWYLRRHPEKEVGFITFSNGKNDGGIGWPQAVAFLRALQETRRPFLFVWGQGGHGQRATMPLSLEQRVLPIDVRLDQSLPAFGRCSLDDDPGGGDPKDGAPEGQVNLYLSWETKDVVDEPGRWEMTVGLIDRAPAAECRVDLTPRRCQRFRPVPGTALRWTNVLPADGREVQSGEAKADALGLVTLAGVTVQKGGSRIRIAP